MLSFCTYRFTGRWLAVVLMIGLFSAFNELEAYDCCQPPSDLTYECDQLPYGFDPYDVDALQSLFGEPVKKCSGYYWFREETPTVELNNCHVGTITRHFVLENGGGKKFTCSQTVTISDVHDYLIYFPKDASAYCEAPDPEPLIERENACDLLAVSKTDALFGTSSSGCYKILRTYRVINWCEYDGESPAVKIGRDEDCDGAAGDEGVWVIRKKTGVVYLDRDENIYNATPGASENDCNGTAGYWKSSEQEPRLVSTGLWQYTQHIKVFDDVQPEVTAVDTEPFCSISNDCEGRVTVDFNVTETCSADAVAVKVFLFANGEAVPLTEENNIAPEALSGAFPDYTISGRFPLGDHLFEVHVKDGCGNSGIAQIPFFVVDCKAPVPVCYHGLSMALMPQEPGVDADQDGDVDELANVVWVSDFIRSGTADCSGPVTYSINRVGEMPDPLRDNLVFTCEDGDTLQVEVYAWDSAYNPYAIQPDGTIGGPNYDHCETYIAIDTEGCPAPTPPARIAGKVKTYTGMSVDQVEIRVSGGMDMMQMTDEEGAYTLNVMPDQHYYLRPYKEDYFMNAVSTRDIILLTHHLMSRRKLTNPYQLIAADVNNSGSVSLLDLVHLRKAILGGMESFPNNQAWRFIPASHVFADPSNPWAEPFPEFDYVEHMTMRPRWANFYAIKVGDIDNSVSGENGRTLAEPAFLALEDTYLEAGRSYAIPLNLAESASALAGLQFELYLDTEALSVERLDEGLLSESYWGASRLEEEGLLAVSWNELGGGAMPAGDLMTIRVRAKRSGYLSDLLQLNQRRITAEAYDAAGDIRPIALEFNTSPLGSYLTIEQNRPNPFRERTQIRFTLPEPGPVRLQVYDLSGRLRYSRLANMDAGEQQLELSRQELGQPGVLIYVLEADGERLSRKMILMP